MRAWLLQRGGAGWDGAPDEARSGGGGGGGGGNAPADWSAGFSLCINYRLASMAMAPITAASAAATHLLIGPLLRGHRAGLRGGAHAVLLLLLLIRVDLINHNPR